MRTLIILSAFLTTNAFAELKREHLPIVRDIMWAAKKVEVPAGLLLAICWNESNFRNHGVTRMDGKSISYGICQVKLGTAKFMDEVYKHRITVTAHRLDDTKINAFYAAKYLHYQLKRYGGNLKKAIDAYNKGAAVSETSDYVKKVTLKEKYFKGKGLK